MNSTLEPSDAELCQRWQNGDNEAAQLLYARFTGRLLELIRTNLATRLLSRIDPESVMHSALKSLLMRTSQGQFEFADDGDVWRLLVTISLNKVRNRVRDAKAAKRDVRREVHTDGMKFDDGLARCLASAPDDEATIIFADLIEALLNRLDPVNREIVQLRLEGLTPEVIGTRLSQPMTSRSVNRRLNGEILEVSRLLLDES